MDYFKKDGKFFFKFGEKDIQVFEDTSLVCPADWNEDLARFLSADEDIVLTEAHWEIIRFMREYTIRTKVTLNNKNLVIRVAEAMGPEKGCTRYLYELFPVHPSRQANKIAGLPQISN